LRRYKLLPRLLILREGRMSFNNSVDFILYRANNEWHFGLPQIILVQLTWRKSWSKSSHVYWSQTFSTKKVGVINVEKTFRPRKIFLLEYSSHLCLISQKHTPWLYQRMYIGWLLQNSLTTAYAKARARIQYLIFDLVNSETETGVIAISLT